MFYLRVHEARSLLCLACCQARSLIFVAPRWPFIVFRAIAGTMFYIFMLQQRKRVRKRKACEDPEDLLIRILGSKVFNDLKIVSRLIKDY